MTLSIGIDVSKKNLDTSYFANGEYVLAHQRVKNDKNHFPQILNRFKQLASSINADDIHVGLEPSGGYEVAIMNFLHDAGISVSLLPPKQLRDYAKGLGRRAKTDKVDAKVIALFVSERNPLCWKPMDEETKLFTSWIRRREQIMQERLREEDRLRKAYLQETPEIVLKEIRRQIVRLKRELEYVEKQIQKLIKNSSDIKEKISLLKSIPGVGDQTARWLYEELNRWENRTGGEGNKKNWIAFVGADPKPDESGKRKGKRRISRQGSSELRRVAWMAALSARRHNARMKAFYERLIAKGKPYKVAMVACMRKLLVWAYAIWKSGEAFEMEYQG